MTAKMEAGTTHPILSGRSLSPKLFSATSEPAHIVIHDAPKIAALEKQFTELYTR